MTRAALEQLLVLSRMAVEENVPDLAVRRHGKGLVKALTRWLRWTQPEESQARVGVPRATDRATPSTATLSVSQGGHSEISRTQGEG
jgi:hypothetical protein